MGNISCKSPTHSYQNVILSQLIEDSLPFCNIFRSPQIAKESDVKFTKIWNMDSIRVKKIMIPDVRIYSKEIKAQKKFKDYCHILIGYKGKKKFIVFDTNNDNNFEDEELHDIDTCNNYIKINNVDFYNGEVKENFTFYVKPLISYITGIPKPGISLMPVYKQGYFKSDSTTYKFALYNMLNQIYTNETPGW